MFELNKKSFIAFTIVFSLFFYLLVLLFSCKSKVQREIDAAVPAKKEILNALAADSSQPKMLWIEGGSFLMGSDDPAFIDAQPLHEVNVKGFWMDEHEITNAEFAKFVRATGYTTVAERPLDSKDYPDVPKDNLVIGSPVFAPPENEVSLADPGQWWRYVAGANWYHPFGPSRSEMIKPNDPVVQVCYQDAIAYAKWVGKRLPTEAEWEYAARAGKQSKNYYWGEELKPAGKWMANIFQGNFPNKNSLEDGFDFLAPVKSFPPNGYGLYDMEGNVWEWCNDFYRPDYYQKSAKENPQGPADSYDPDEPNVVKRVVRGGSFLCSDQYCIRYKAGSRGKGEINSASNNLGFRCVKDAR